MLEEQGLVLANTRAEARASYFKWPQRTMFTGHPGCMISSHCINMEGHSDLAFESCGGRSDLRT